MDLDGLLHDLTPELHGILGPETVTLSRPAGMSAGGGATPATLAAAAAALAGASSVNLRLPISGPLRGEVRQGARLVIGGATYLVTARTVLPAPPAPSVSTGPVSIAPPLAAPLAEGAAVTILPAEYTWTDAVVIYAGAADTGGDPSAEPLLVVSLPVATAPAGVGAPQKGDGLHRPYDGTRGLVSEVPVALGGAWDVRVGKR
jgi:hypothetical protein